MVLNVNQSLHCIHKLRKRQTNTIHEIIKRSVTLRVLAKETMTNTFANLTSQTIIGNHNCYLFNCSSLLFFDHVKIMKCFKTVVHCFIERLQSSSNFRKSLAVGFVGLVKEFDHLFE